MMAYQFLYKPPSIQLNILGRWDIWERMLPKISEEADEWGCWNWVGWDSGNGYGKVSVDGKSCMAHRAAWSIFNGPIPEGLLLDHVKELCDSRACINPLHLQIVTDQENTQRGDAVLFGDINHAEG